MLQYPRNVTRCAASQDLNFCRVSSGPLRYFSKEQTYMVQGDGVASDLRLESHGGDLISKLNLARHRHLKSIPPFPYHGT